jgi:site-specific DNA recombinase
MEFNSIDAQREAAQAYIASQAQSGWKAVGVAYEDAGVSGATLRRPAMVHLLRDVQRKQIDIVVVHKIDRLTRSLRDFSQIISLFESFGTDIVSVTQQFNTTSSMGRLTLNMMLSFAQFEREICSERLKDKIDASKKKGIWMGGFVPLGYRSVDRKLAIEPAEAAIVRGIFLSWISSRSAAAIATDLEERGIRTKRRVTAKGRTLGGRPYTMKCIHRLLRDPTYLGLVKHKGTLYPGQHPAIIDRQTWEQAQAGLALPRSPISQPTHSLLAGLLYGPGGDPFYYVYTDKAKRRYGYYISRSEARFGTLRKTAHRISAASIESAVSKEICKRLASNAFALELAEILKQNSSCMNAAVSALELIGVLRKAPNLWSGLDAPQKRILAKALIERIDLGSHDSQSTVRITWTTHPLSTPNKEHLHAV